jgi:hypothetical protein
MSVILKPGSRLFSAACTTEVIVVRAPSGDVDLTIGGVPPVAAAADRPTDGSPVPGYDTGTTMGKRYVDDSGALELLCTKPGAGSLAVDGAVLAVKDAKPLPSSD